MSLSSINFFFKLISNLMVRVDCNSRWCTRMYEQQVKVHKILKPRNFPGYEDLGPFHQIFPTVKPDHHQPQTEKVVY